MQISVTELMKNLLSKNPNYIRCVKVCLFVPDCIQCIRWCQARLEYNNTDYQKMLTYMYNNFN